MGGFCLSFPHHPLLSLLNASSAQDPRFAPASDSDSVSYYVWLCSLLFISYLIVDSARSAVARDRETLILAYDHTAHTLFWGLDLHLYPLCLSSFSLCLHWSLCLCTQIYQFSQTRAFSGHESSHLLVPALPADQCQYNDQRESLIPTPPRISPSPLRFLGSSLVAPQLGWSAPSPSELVLILVLPLVHALASPSILVISPLHLAFVFHYARLTQLRPLALVSLPAPCTHYDLSLFHSPC